MLDPKSLRMKITSEKREFISNKQTQAMLQHFGKDVGVISPIVPFLLVNCNQMFWYSRVRVV
jgi:hypothetical protein